MPRDPQTCQVQDETMKSSPACPRRAGNVSRWALRCVRALVTWPAHLPPGFLLYLALLLGWGQGIGGDSRGTGCASVVGHRGPWGQFCAQTSEEAAPL